MKPVNFETPDFEKIAKELLALLTLNQINQVQFIARDFSFCDNGHLRYLLKKGILWHD